MNTNLKMLVGAEKKPSEAQLVVLRQEFTPQHPERGGFHVAWPPEGESWALFWSVDGSFLGQTDFLGEGICRISLLYQLCYVANGFISNFFWDYLSTFWSHCKFFGLPSRQATWNPWLISQPQPWMPWQRMAFAWSSCLWAGGPGKPTVEWFETLERWPCGSLVVAMFHENLQGEDVAMEAAVEVKCGRRGKREVTGGLAGKRGVFQAEKHLFFFGGSLFHVSFIFCSPETPFAHSNCQVG